MNPFRKYCDLIFAAILTLIIVMFVGMCCNAQTPDVYHQFNGTGATALQATNGGAAHNIVPGDVPYTINTGGLVGNYMTKDIAANTTGMKAGNVSFTNQATVQVMFKPGKNFQIRVNGVYDGIIPLIKAGGVEIDFQYPFIILNTNNGADMDYIELNGVNKASWANLQDGSWHLITVTVNNTGPTGQKRLYIDGQSPAMFLTSGPTGNIQNTDPAIYLVKDGNLNRMYAGDIDEVAIYNTALTANQVWQCWVDVSAGNHYSGGTAATVPAYAPVTAAFDPLEYAEGYTVGGVAIATPIKQLQACPKPRAKPISIASDSLPPNLEGADFIYIGENTFNGVSSPQAVLNAAECSKYWATYFNAVLSLNQIGNQNPADTNTLVGKIVKIKNANSQLPLSGSTYLAQRTNPNLPWDSQNYCIHGEFPLKYSFQNSSGVHMDENGNVCPNWPPPFGLPTPCSCGLGRQSRPTGPTNQAMGFPWSNLAIPGAELNSYMTPLDAALTGTNKIDWIWENREVFKLIQPNILALDPVVEADRVASGLNSRDYQSRHVAGCESAYYNAFIGTLPVTTGTKVLGYQTIAPDAYFFNFQYTQTNYATWHGKKLASTDIYANTPSKWWQGSGPNHGLSWRRGTMKPQLLLTDSAYIDFVSAGWDFDDTKNISPVQWLGMCKIMGAWGSHSFITYIPTLFESGKPNPNPRNYIGTVLAIPPYAHAINTRLERFLNNGILMPGDIMADPVNTNDPAYQYNMGDFRVLCVVRKRPTAEIYSITTALMRNGNMIGNTEDSVIRSVVINGITLTLVVKEQGCTYIWDNSVPADPKLLQLDKWHEDKHPTRWSSDFNFEAEVNDNFDPQQPVTYKTYQRAGAGPGDYVGSKTVVSYSGAVTDSVRFNGVPTVTSTYYGWVLARSKTGAATSIKVRMNTGAAVTLPVNSTQWGWYRWDNGIIAGSGINWALTADVPFHLAFIAADNNVEIDQIVLTKTPNAGYPEISNPCGIITSNITPSGATTFCTGGSVTLTATPATLYKWSTGATTQAIAVNSSGTFTVTITDGTGCTGVSSPTIVTVNVPPAVPPITASGPTTFCSGSSVDLTAPGGMSAYLWSNGATMQTVTISTSASYRVTVTNSFGCTASSNLLPVTVNALPAIPTITPGGATTFCNGGNVGLTATASTTYRWSTGQTSQSITVSPSSSTTYTVTVTNAAGCSRVSAGTTVTVNGNPILGSITNKANTCPTATFDLSTIVLVNTGAAGTTSYHSSQANAIANVAMGSPVVAASGTYWLRVTTGSGCFDYKSVTVTINPCACATPTTANAGPDQSVCSGTIVTLAGVIGGSANAGTWTTSGTGTFSPNATTMGATYTASPADTVTGSVTITLTSNNPAGAPCVVATDQMLIIYNAHPSASATPTGSTSFCSGQSVNIAVPNMASYLWSNGATTQGITATASASYWATVTNAPGCTGLTNVITVMVNSNPPVPAVTNIGSLTFCAGSSVTLSAQPFTSYLWSTGATTQSINSTTTATYTVTVTNTAGCTNSSAPVNTIANPTPTTPVISSSAGTSVCTGSSTLLSSTGNAGSTWLWSNGNTVQSFTTATIGSYTVTVTENGCTASSTTFTLSSLIPANATVSYTPPAQICQGGSIVLTAAFNSTYLWSNFATTQSITVNSAGSYSVTVTNPFGCTGVSVPVLVTQAPAISNAVNVTGSTTFCNGNSVTLTAANGYNYQWSNGQTTQGISVTTSGTYIVTITTTGGCSAVSAPILVNVTSGPGAISISPPSPVNICPTQSANLIAPAASSYLWSDGETTQNIFTLIAGVYTVTVTNISGCSASASATVQFGTALVPVISVVGSTTICNGQSKTLTASAATGWIWSNGATTQAINATVAGTYIVTVVDAYGCTKSSAAKVLTVNEAPTAIIDPTDPDLTFCNGSAIGLYAPIGDGYRYVWSNGSTYRALTIRSTGTFTVTVTNATGCSSISPAVTVTKDNSCTISCTKPTGVGVKDIQNKKDNVTGIKVPEATIYWDQTVNIDSARVCIRILGKTGTEDCVNTKNKDTRFLKKTHLKFGTTYEYWVFGWCVGVKTDSSAVKQFKTLFR